jgi:hypothetical protein
VVPGRIVSLLFSIKVGTQQEPEAGSRRRPRQFNLLYRDFTLRDRSLDLEQVLGNFAFETQIAVGEFTRKGVFVHSGAVGWKGHALLLPGHSFSGKSRLVLELIRQGATYYSDEYAVLDDEGQVRPYARPLAIRSDSDAGEPSDLGVPEPVVARSIGRRALPVALVAALQYQRDAEFRPRAVSAGQGFIDLMRSAVPVREHPRETMKALGAVSARALFLRGKRGEAASAAEQLLERLDRLASKPTVRSRR